jgi:hypothetical protein
MNLIFFGRWIASGRSGWLFYICSFGFFFALGLVLGINSPSVIACPNMQNYCYLLRLDKNKVIIPKTQNKR